MALFSPPCPTPPANPTHTFCLGFVTTYRLGVVRHYWNQTLFNGDDLLNHCPCQQHARVSPIKSGSFRTASSYRLLSGHAPLCLFPTVHGRALPLDSCLILIACPGVQPLEESRAISDQIDVRSLYAAPFPHDATLDAMMAIFEAAAPVVALRMRRHLTTKDFRGSIFVEFDSEAAARKVCRVTLWNWGQAFRAYGKLQLRCGFCMLLMLVLACTSPRIRITSIRGICNVRINRHAAVVGWVVQVMAQRLDFAGAVLQMQPKAQYLSRKKDAAAAKTAAAAEEAKAAGAAQTAGTTKAAAGAAGVLPSIGTPWLSCMYCIPSHVDILISGTFGLVADLRRNRKGSLKHLD